ncbi:D-alanyl-D-alanine carboxypeptidase family protein [Anaerocolumna sp. MB42-C2]|uniref:D-alanyl-D-alanine carboxypeptidase family protein n=1 Tax=Anaerocolumna sp. MB42-C2 TaxID=3070997 RepID=UPI0027E0C3AE|nr:serine hydrolase [Anaerocolumna sp. MB42-C2]WMJ88254.1 serine hydrolase [Anaerocolumna sp. MB42-C2]
MKKKLICIVIALTILTGCSRSTEVLLPYSETDNLISHENNIGTEEVSDFFASDLTIIPDELNHMDDSSITATSALIVNTSDDVVLYANNVYERMYPASLTKLMTALVVLKEANLKDTVAVSYNASHITESGAKLCGFKEGDKINLDDLLNCLLVYSGNDAGVAIAEHVGGSLEGFAKKMNETAKSVGAVHSNFVNPHGLHDDNHYTTAYDLYLIFNELIKYDKFVSIINQESYTTTYKDAEGQDITKEFATTNRYLKGTEKAPDGVTVVGGKTGTTSKAGNCLILYSKDNKKKSYISLILQADGGNSLFSQMTHLLDKIN